MKKIKAVLIDDEPLALETLEMTLNRKCPEVEVIQKYSKPLEALEAIPNLKFDILFLDIEMPRINGIELLKQIKNPSFDVIFTTAYDEFAIDAIKTSALDYLLKPINIQELMDALDKFRNKQERGINSSNLESLFSKMGYGFERIALPASNGLIFAKAENILRCESDNNYTTFYFVDGQKHFISKTLKDVEELLKGHGFLRVHQSHLVNLNHVKQYIKSDGGYLVMLDDTSISVSRAKKEELYRLFSKY